MTEDEKANLIILKDSIRQSFKKNFEEIFEMNFRLVRFSNSDFYIGTKTIRGIMIDLFDDVFTIHYSREGKMVSLSENEPIQNLIERCKMLKWQIDNEPL